MLTWDRGGCRVRVAGGQGEAQVLQVEPPLQALPGGVQAPRGGRPGRTRRQAPLGGVAGAEEEDAEDGPPAGDRLNPGARRRAGSHLQSAPQGA